MDSFQIKFLNFNIAPISISTALKPPKVFSQKSDELNYRIGDIVSFYNKEDIISIPGKNGIMYAPYTMEHNYRKDPCHDWGAISFDGNYQLPPELINHRQYMIKNLKRKNKLKKNNNPAPRVKDFTVADNIPQFRFEDATYYDQVATNLSLDLKDVINSKETIRNWDITQSGTSEGMLPKISSSKLANTLGVAIGIYFYDANGKKQIIRRYRGKNVAVYPNTWHLPFSFALTYLEDETTYSKTSMKEFVNFDLGREQAEELFGLEPNDFGPPTPIAFCRDLIRGGKPQLFLEMELKVPFEEFKNKVWDYTGEFQNKISKIHESEDIQYSPELLAYTVLDEITK
jgi:hypothetical protein